MHDVTLLDGGMGQELLRRSTAPPTPLWSAKIMQDDPDMVRDLHVDFIRAGAEVITFNAYSATRCRLGPMGEEHAYEDLQRLAGSLAREARDAARDEFGTTVRLAGCLSPYGWSYRPELTPPYDELWPTFAESARLQAPDADLFICETMASIDEGRAAATGAATTGKPVWVAWTLRDDDQAILRSGEPLREAVAAVSEIPEVIAQLVNCSVPEAITAAMPVMVASGRTVGGYANGFTNIADDFQAGQTVELLSARTDLCPEEYADLAMTWVEAGAQIVGGCCEIGPAHIAEIARRLGRHS